MAEIKRHLHHVMVFASTETEGKQAALYFYRAPKVGMAKRWFKEEHPTKRLIKAISLGTKEYTVDARKYHALYEDS